jgi:hypothetical protein
MVEEYSIFLDDWPGHFPLLNLWPVLLLFNYTSLQPTKVHCINEQMIREDQDILVVMHSCIIARVLR